MSLQTARKQYILFACAIGGFLPLNSTVFAQDTGVIENKAPESTTQEVKAKKKSDEKGTEKIQVTGSRLKKIDVEGSTPIKVIDQEEIQKAGITSVSDLFRNQTENSFGSYMAAAVRSPMVRPRSTFAVSARTALWFSSTVDACLPKPRSAA